MRKPETRYARSGDVNIAYQVVGEGPRDLVLVPGWVSNVELFWEEPTVARFLERLTSFTRLILFDKRGTGLSDRVSDVPNLETRMDDLRAVMDAARSPRAALLGYSEGGSMCALFAATYPERTTALIMVGSYPRRIWAPDYLVGPTREEWLLLAARFARDWGGPLDIDIRAPSLATDTGFRDWWARFLRQSASPRAAHTIGEMITDIDIRSVLPTIRVPTLLLHNTRDQAVPVEHSRYMAEHIPGAKYVELDGIDHLPWSGNGDAILDEIEEFLTGVRHGADGSDVDRVLATVLFTDIVDSTKRAAELGDRRWREALDRHHGMVRRELTAFRGREIDTAGDGFLASFDGPARAIRAATTITDKVKLMGLDIRAGLHTGECEVLGPKLTGIAVHIGARIAALAGSGEVLVSSTVRDLVAGSGLRFRDRGVHALKGIPGEWQLYAVEKD
jgi:pimeloyl-ACP methyl ester carboxylesterase